MDNTYVYPERASLSEYSGKIFSWQNPLHGVYCCEKRGGAEGTDKKVECVSEQGKQEHNRMLKIIKKRRRCRE